ncbi:hypothetical protein NE473_31455, partial [Hungatella sp. SL.1.14]|nr:hypothetical protein [Hungatella sp. SL.1.14]
MFSEDKKAIGYADDKLCSDFIQMWADLMAKGAAPNPDEYAAIQSRVTIAEVPEGQLGVLYINHAASAVVTDREAAYWNVWEPC